MNTRSCRRFILADSVILIAVVAAGFGIARLQVDLQRRDLRNADAVSAFHFNRAATYWCGLLILVALLPVDGPCHRVHI
jgi:hypothetical protein